MQAAVGLLPLHGEDWDGLVKLIKEVHGKREQNSSLLVFVWRVMLELLEDRYGCPFHP
jgi:hypothetical protein